MKSEKLITIEKQIEKLVIQRHKESLKCIKKSFKQLFADYPDLQSFGGVNIHRIGMTVVRVSSWFIMMNL